MLRECEAYVHRAGWWQPTSIFLVDHVKAPPGGISGLGVIPAPIPESMWEYSPQELLDGMANGWTGPASRFVAVVVVFEAWIAMIDPNDPASMEAVRAQEDDL